jgi:hypothetical protein
MNNICSSNFPYNRTWQFIARSIGTRFIASVGDDVAFVGDDAASSSSPLDTPLPEIAQETEQPQSSLVVSGKKRGKKKGRLVSVEEIMPKPSYWPLALAVSFIVLLMGIMISWIVIVIGAVLVIASVIGWSLERR